MPIKEIITIATVIIGAWSVTEGRAGILKHVRKVQIQILREVSRTDTWGNPSIFQYRPSKRVSRRIEIKDGKIKEMRPNAKAIRPVRQSVDF